MRDRFIPTSENRPNSRFKSQDVNKERLFTEGQGTAWVSERTYAGLEHASLPLGRHETVTAVRKNKSGRITLLGTQVTVQENIHSWEYLQKSWT